MSNVRSANVDFIDTTDTALADVKSVCGIKYVGAASGTAVVKSLADGATLWEHSGNVLVFEEVEIFDQAGIEVEVTNSAKVYIYKK